MNKRLLARTFSTIIHRYATAKRLFETVTTMEVEDEILKFLSVNVVERIFIRSVQRWRRRLLLLRERIFIRSVQRWRRRLLLLRERIFIRSVPP